MSLNAFGRCMYAIVLIQLFGCAALYRDLQAPGLDLLSIQPVGIDSGMNLRMLARLRLSNPNSVALPVQGGELLLTLNGVEVGESRLTENFRIPANGSENIELPVSLNLSRGLAIGMEMLSGQRVDLDYRLRGHVDVGMAYLGRIPIDQQGSIAAALPRL